MGKVILLFYFYRDHITATTGMKFVTLFYQSNIQ